MVVVAGCCLQGPGGCAGQATTTTTTTAPATTTTTARPTSPTASPLPGTCGAVCSLDQPCQPNAGLYCAYPNLLCGVPNPPLSFFLGLFPGWSTED